MGGRVGGISGNDVIYEHCRLTPMTGTLASTHAKWVKTLPMLVESLHSVPSSHENRPHSYKHWTKLFVVGLSAAVGIYKLCK